MCQCFCNNPEDCVIFQFVDKSEKRLSGKELVKVIESNIKYDLNNIDNKDLSD